MGLMVPRQPNWSRTVITLDDSGATAERRIF